MTRQMADDEVLRVSADDAEAARRYVRDWCPDSVRDYVTALQAERDADKAALEALRGQVAGLLNTCVDVIEEGLCASQSYDYRARAEGCAEQIKELLADQRGRAG